MMLTEAAAMAHAARSADHRHIAQKCCLDSENGYHGEGMTPNEFIAKWRAVELKESSAAQEHFIDLCRLLGEPTPAEADPTGEHYCFERGATKDTGGGGWADVWKRHHFAWEYKGKHANLDAAFAQLRQYVLALGEPTAADRLRHDAVPHPH